MRLLTRSAIVQARVRPELKYASEQVLRRIGLSMTEAMELFLRRVIVDQTLPFEIAALDDATLVTIADAWKASSQDKETVADLDARRARRAHRPKRE